MLSAVLEERKVKFGSPDLEQKIRRLEIWNRGDKYSILFYSILLPILLSLSAFCTVLYYSIPILLRCLLFVLYARYFRTLTHTLTNLLTQSHSYLYYKYCMFCVGCGRHGSGVVGEGWGVGGGFPWLCGEGGLFTGMHTESTLLDGLNSDLSLDVSQILNAYIHDDENISQFF